MNIQQLQLIMKRVVQDVICPKCKAKLDTSKMEVRSVGESNVEFSSVCETCSAKAIVSAQMGPPKVTPMSQAPLEKNIRTNLVDTLQTFESQDIRDLFR